MSTHGHVPHAFVDGDCELISATAKHSLSKEKKKKIMRRSQQKPAPVILNDRLEHDRIMLETNLRHSEAVIHLSESDADDLESLEYPRHNSGHASLGELPSLDHRVRDYLADEDTPGQGWSYRTVDDDEGVHPYGGESLSTLAHHASAVTLGAGLGGRGARRDASMSGAEYDPDRPIHDIIAGVNTKFDVFDPKRQVNECLGCNIFLQVTISRLTKWTTKTRLNSTISSRQERSLAHIV